MPNMRSFVEMNTRALDKSHIREYLYRPACACNSPAWWDAGAVLMRWCSRHAADPDMPNMHPFVEATTRASAGVFWSESKHLTLVWDM